MYCLVFLLQVSPAFTNSIQMTALNFRKNMREFLPWAVTATKTTVKIATKTTVNVATKTCQSINASEKVHDIRCRAAAFVMPNDMAFVITPKENI